MDLLGLNNTEATELRVEQRGERMVTVVTARYGAPQPAKLGAKTLHRHGYRLREVPDTPLHGRPCMIEVQVPRIKDTETGKVCTPDVHWIHPRWRMTRRLREHICERALRDRYRGEREPRGVDRP